MSLARLVALLSLLAISSLITGCSNSNGTEQTSRLVITGSSTIAPLATEIARAYEHANPEVRVDVQSGGSSRGISDVRRQLADIGMVSRKIKMTENDLSATTLARDGIALIVHSSNPVTNLSEQQIHDIYTGKVRNWQAIGGMNSGINVIHKAEGRSTLEVFLKYFKLSNKDITADTIIGENEQAIKLVAGNPRSIAYVSIGTARYDAEHGTPIRLVSLDHVEPTLRNVASGQFPLTRELNLITSHKRNPLVEDFLLFSKRQTQLIQDQQFVALD